MFILDFKARVNNEEYADGIIQGMMLVDQVPGLLLRVATALFEGKPPPQDWHLRILADLEYALEQSEP